METDRKEKFIHAVIIFLSSLIILIVAIILTVFLLTPSATKQGANIQKQLKHQISLYPQGQQLKSLIDVEEARVSGFLVGLYGRCVEGVAKLSEAIQSLNRILDSLLAASDVKTRVMIFDVILYIQNRQLSLSQLLTVKTIFLTFLSQFRPNIQTEKNQNLQQMKVIQVAIFIIQMTEVQSELPRQKNKEEYSRNVKKLKVKLQMVQDESFTLQKKIDTLSNTCNDKMIALKIAKFCKQRRFTPEMLFRFADRKNVKTVSKLQFHETLTNLGLKLTKEQMMRVEYLIDEDLSGSISWSEYNGYLDAFGIKKEFTPGELTAKQALGKLDLDKMLKINKENEEDQVPRQKKKHANLLTYEDFLKYCHKNFKDMKDRQIATIFERLQRNQLINLQTFFDYLQDQQDQQKKLQEKNNKIKIKRGESLKQDAAARKKAESLKGLIQALFRSRVKNSLPTFHSAEFQRLEKLLNRSRGELTNIFKQIDSKRRATSLGQIVGRGSFGFNQLISYFIDHQQKSQDLIYAFQLMGHKLNIFKHNPETIIGQYTKQQEVMSQQQLSKFLECEFELPTPQIEIIKKIVPWESKAKVLVSKLIELMKIEQSRGIMYIRPQIPAERLIFRSGLMALRCCLQIEQKMIKAKQAQWHDSDFGPNEADEFGLESIEMSLPSQSVSWQRIIQLGMNQFFQAGLTSNLGVMTSASCPHQIIAQSIYSLALADSEWLHPRSKPNPETRQVTEVEFSYLFKGIFPYAFQPFNKYGIYVIKLWIDQKWKYVVIDDKIPCGIDKKPFFSATKNLRYSFVSLIQKALAKIYGNYKQLFSLSYIQRYMVELTGGLCLPSNLTPTMPQQLKDSLWSDVINSFEVENKKSKDEQNRSKDIFFGSFKGKKEGINQNFILNAPLKIDHALQIANAEKKNKHKSHRLLFFDSREPTNQKQWNRGWCKELTDSKYYKNRKIIEEATNKKIAENENNIVLNYKLFRKGFNLIRLIRVDWEQQIVLRKEIQFEEKFKCRYELISKSNQLELIIYLKQTSIQSDVKILLDLKSLEDGKETLLSQRALKDVLSIHSQKFEKGKTFVLQFYVQNWRPDLQYLYNLTFYFSNPRYQLKQRDRHMLFRYVSPNEQNSKFQWKQLTKEQQQYIYNNFYKAAQRRGCFGCL